MIKVTLPDAPRPGRPVLLIERSREIREVLRTVLLRRGFAVTESVPGSQPIMTGGRANPIQTAQDLTVAAERPTPTSGASHQRATNCAVTDPLVVVLDGDDVSHEDWRRWCQRCQQCGAGLVVLGDLAADPRGGALIGRQVAKPYHFGNLIRTIEEVAAEVESQFGSVRGSEVAASGSLDSGVATPVNS